MNEIDNVIAVTAATMAIIHLIGPAAIWRMTTAVGEWLLVILVLIWAL